jgi:hypothetical protein
LEATVAEFDAAAMALAREKVVALLTMAKACRSEREVSAGLAIYGAAYAAGVAAERARAIALAMNPYGDEVAAMAGDEPFAVGKKIAAALRDGPRGGS